MRKNKIVVLLLLVAIMVLSATLVACVPVEEAHVCGHVCSTCGKCTDAACTNSVCADKCQGHTPAAHTKCPNCEGCLDASCTECEYTCECVITDEQALEKAVTLVKNDYKEKTVITASTDFAAITSINGYEENRTDRKTFPVSIVWTLENVQGVADTVSLTKKEDGSAYTLAVVYNSEHNTKETTFSLKAVITCGDKSETWTLNSSVPQFKYTTYEEWLANCKANDGTMMNIKAYVIGVVNYESSSKGSLYLQDADGHGYYAYNPTGAADDCANTADLRAKWPVGTEVIVSGTGVVYSGQYEFNKGCTVAKTGNTAESAGVTLDYVDATTDFAAAKSNEDNDTLCKYQNRRVTLKDATITNVSIEYNSDGATFKRVYYYFTLPGSDVEFNVYYTIYFIDEDVMKDLHSKLVVGKIVDLTGVVSVYSSDFQVYPDSATSVSNVRDAELTDAQKVAMAKENLTISTAITTTGDITLPVTGDLETSITWAIKDDKTYDFVALADGKFTVSALPTQDTEIVLVATITKGKASDTKEITVTVASSFVMSEIHGYVGYINQVTAGKKLYLDGGVSDRYLTTTTDVTKAVSVYAEKVEGGYKFYILVDSAKQYITIYANGENKDSVKYDATGETVFTYDPTVNAFVTTFGGSEKYLGTYKTFETVSVSNRSYLTAENTGVSNFTLEILPIVEGAKYVGHINQVTAGKQLYLDGGVSDRYLTTTTDATKAVSVYVEKVEGGYKLYILVDSAKQYITIYANGENKDSVKYDATGTTVFTYDPSVHAFVTTFNGVEKYLGTYKTFETVSVSNRSYLTAENTGVSNFTLELNLATAPSTGEGGGSEGTDTPDPSAKITTIADAINASAGAEVELTGTVSSIKNEWSEQYNNMSFYITDGTKTILVFRAGTKVGVGDVVSVSGTTAKPYSDVEIAQGATVTITTAHVCSFNDATCTTPKTCPVCGKTEGDALGHTEANAEGKCGRCGLDLEAASKFITVTAKHSSTSTTNMTGGNDAATLGLDATIFSAVSTKTNSGNNHVGLNKDGTMRLYKKTTATLTISVAEGYEIVSISVELGSSVGTLEVAIDGTVVTAVNGEYTINGSSVSLYNTHTDNQTYIKSITIVYAPVTAE